jgi:carbon storage regulator
MLVISRRLGETILIGDNIEIQVTDVTPSRVKLGIRAPRELEVMRKEVKLAGERNREASVAGGEEALRRLLTALRPSS